MVSIHTLLPLASACLYSSATSSTASKDMDDPTTYGSGTTIIPPASGSEHEATFIFLHGFGETVEENWLPVLLPLAEKVRGIKWILPQAPLIPSSYNNGTLFPAWFDTPTLNFLDPSNDDIPHQNQAITYLLSLIDSEVGVGAEGKRMKVIIGGYSQGATIALRTLLTACQRGLGGLVVLKGWVARSGSISDDVREGYEDTPIFWAAGTEDEVVTPAITNRSLEIMAELGVRIDLSADTPFVDHGIAFQYNPNEGHDIMPAELDQMITWLQAATFHDE